MLIDFILFSVLGVCLGFVTVKAFERGNDVSAQRRLRDKLNGADERVDGMELRVVFAIFLSIILAAFLMGS